MTTSKPTPLPKRPQAEVALDLLRDGKLLRLRDFARHGVQSMTLTTLCESGAVTRVGRGMYRLAEAEETPDIDLAELAARVPDSVLCLISAAFRHGLTTAIPNEAWVLIPARSRRPTFTWPPARFLKSRTEAAFTLGVDRFAVAGVPVSITNPARTVVDLFRLQKIVGVDLAMEALRAFVAAQGSLSELQDLAEAFGCGSAMEPYTRFAAVAWDMH